MDNDSRRLLGIKEDADDITYALHTVSSRVSEIGESVGFPSPLGHSNLTKAVGNIDSAIKNVQSHTEYLPLTM